MEDMLCPACGRSNSEFDTHCSACGAPLSMTEKAAVADGFPPEPSSTADEEGLLGRQVSHFRIQRRIGRGGMGVVYQALDLDLGRVVALKFLSGGERNPRDETRFRREAQATAALDHPNIGTIYEVGEHDGQRFIAMAYYDGETLATRLAREGALSITDTAAIAGQLASALAAAHDAGIIHRDLKPDNVMIARDRRVKLLDFGLAKWKEGASVTERGMVIGTAAYMAPEQLRGESGAAADLWAFGVMLYEMLTGERPFGGERKGMVHAIFYEDPPPLHNLRPDTPEVLEQIVARCLTKEPSERFSSAAEILALLDTAGLWSPGTSGSGIRLETPARKRNGWVWLAVSALAATVAVATLLWVRQPATTIYVAVLKPEITGTIPTEDRSQVTLNLQSALLRTIASLKGLAALDNSQVNAIQGTPAAIARAVAADEVLASQADCSGDICQVSLRRLAGADGRVLWSDTLRLPSSNPSLFANALAATLRRAYAGLDLRVPQLELDIEDHDFEEFLDLRQQAGNPGAAEEILNRLAAIRQRAPRFLDAYVLEAWMAWRLYLETGEARHLERGLSVAGQALDLFPEDPRPLSTLFSLNLDSGRLDEAEAVLRRMEAVDPAGSLLRQGQLAERRGDPEKSLRLMAEAARLQPSWQTLLTVANAEYRQGQLDDARRLLDELLERSPGNVEGLRTLAQIELLRNPDRAVALLRQAAERDSGPKSLTNLGLAPQRVRR